MTFEELITHPDRVIAHRLVIARDNTGTQARYGVSGTYMRVECSLTVGASHVTVSRALIADYNWKTHQINAIEKELPLQNTVSVARVNDKHSAKLAIYDYTKNALLALNRLKIRDLKQFKTYFE